ncbi:TolC family protein [Geomonas sp. RF6]|uniref:TolC family protein n=1 Tax=Geomonas sp. RF6 TaxID=2897342 RepID=UPI001E32FCB6|nr:TolC family protein [Geomonas sp. RF6]UFS69814.1 TolC family protein [Geomonas sp. RF6]
MNARLRLCALAVTLLLSAGTLSAAETKPPVENLGALVETALSNNPELAGSQARWQMFTNRAAQATAFEDPMLMLKVQNGIITDPFNFSKDPMTQKVIGISQQIPFFGKRALKGEVAAREAEALHWTHEERKLELARMVKENYYQIYFTDKALAIVDKNIRIMDDFITLAQTKYSVGQGMQQDVFKSQVERSKMLDMRIGLEQQRASLVAALNALLYRPATTPVGTIPDFELTPLALTAEELRNRALERRPQIKGLQAQIEKATAGRKLAQREFYPDFNVSLEYMQRQPSMNDEGLDMYSLGVTFNLPVQQKRRHAMVAEANSEINMATAEVNMFRNTVDAGIADLLAKLEKRRRLVELYKTGIIPQAEQSLESATIGYRVNKVDFLSLLDSRNTLFGYEREYYESMAEYQMQLAQLEALVGGLK